MCSGTTAPDEWFCEDCLGATFYPLGQGVSSNVFGFLHGVVSLAGMQGEMMAAIPIGQILAVLLTLHLIALSIAAYVISRRK